VKTPSAAMETGWLRATRTDKNGDFLLFGMGKKETIDDLEFEAVF